MMLTKAGLQAIRERVWQQRCSSPPDPSLALRQSADIPALLALIEELTVLLQRLRPARNFTWNHARDCPCEYCSLGREITAAIGEPDAN